MKDAKWKNYPVFEELRAGRHVPNRDSVNCSFSESQTQPTWNELSAHTNAKGVSPMGRPSPVD